MIDSGKNVILAHAGFKVRPSPYWSKLYSDTVAQIAGVVDGTDRFNEMAGHHNEECQAECLLIIKLIVKSSH